MNVRKWTPEVEQKIYDEFHYKPTPMQMNLIEMAWKSSIGWTHAFSGTFTNQAFEEARDGKITKRAIAEGLCREFTNCLNSRCGKPNARRKCKKQPDMRLPMIGALEGGSNFTRLNSHFLLATPRPMIDRDFEKIIEYTWGRIDGCGTAHNKLEPIYDLAGWVKYISKEFHSRDTLAIYMPATHLY